MSKKITAFVLVLAILTSARFAKAQEPGEIRRIGFLSVLSASSSRSMRLYETLRQALRNLGWIEGKNISIESRWMAGKRERLPALAEELLRLKVEVVVVHGGHPARLVQQMNKTIPIVMAEASDAVGRGIIQSLAHPGGNITGLTSIQAELGAKRLELLKEIVPDLSRVAMLWTPKSPASRYEWKEIQPLARQLGLQLHSIQLRRLDDLDKTLEDTVKVGVGALAVTSGVSTHFDRKRITDLAAKHHLPIITTDHYYVDAGALMSYTRDTADLFRRAATYVDKILKGAKPADLPVQQPVKFNLVVNLKTAKTLGITIPPTVLYQATKVIQ